MKVQRLPRATGEALEPARLVSLAGALDVAGDALKVMAKRQLGDGDRRRHLVRASLCYAAAVALRRIAE